jgi:hypothetical protein
MLYLLAVLELTNTGTQVARCQSPKEAVNQGGPFQGLRVPCCDAFYGGLLDIVFCLFQGGFLCHSCVCFCNRDSDSACLGFVGALHEALVPRQMGASP